MPKFSLTSLFLLITVIPLGYIHIMNQRQIRDMREELEELRDIAGRLEISEPTRTHAIPIPTNASLTWSWQVYIPPPSNRHRLVLDKGEIQQDGSIGYGGGSTGFETSGRFVLNASIEKNIEGDLILTTRHHGRSFSCNLEDDIWETANECGIEPGKTTVGVAGEPITLLRLKGRKNGFEIRIRDKLKP